MQMIRTKKILEIIIKIQITSLEFGGGTGGRGGGFSDGGARRSVLGIKSSALKILWIFLIHPNRMELDLHASMMVDP